MTPLALFGWGAVTGALLCYVTIVVAFRRAARKDSE